MNSRTSARILIVDDHPMVREGLAARIATQRDLQVCGEAASEDEAVAMALETRPDLVLVDISLKSGNGMDVIRQVRARDPNIKFLVISGYQESLYAERALRAGAHGYLNKQESNEMVLQAIRAVLTGQRFVSPEMTQKLVSQALTGHVDSRPAIERLTNRELQVFRLIGEGHSSGAIAEQLFLSTHTIDTHRENLKRKLGLRSAGELTRTAVQWVLENS